jgi:hypothetical protein
MAVLFVFALLLLSLAAAGAPAPAPPPVTLTGTRTIVNDPGQGRAAMTTVYPVMEQDIGMGNRMLTFGLPAALPEEGMQPITESVTSVMAFPNGTPVETSSAVVAARINLGVRQPFPVNDVRTVTTTKIDERAAADHIVQVGTGANGDGFAHVDLIRTTNGDGTFEEHGSQSEGGLYELHVGADFHAEPHSRSGSSQLDIVTGPSGGDQITTTMRFMLSSPGGIIDSGPVVGGRTYTYTASRWFPAQPGPTLVEHITTQNAALPADCNPATAAPAVLLVHHRRRQIDPTRGVRESIHDTYYDPSYAAVCRIETDSDIEFEISTGNQRRSLTQRTVVARVR